ncbi:CopD family protein [Streptomyces sp. NPDC058045]|uniref:CopD family protein n=1 Tax=Streptomyces sp. NPDC058045 TaxID=3346311 RepID=UPI0036E5DAD3
MSVIPSSVETEPEARAQEGRRRFAGGAGRAVAVLVLVAVAALIPLLGAGPALHGTGEAEAPGTPGIALARAVLFAGICVPLGEVFAARLARGLPGLGPPPPGLGRVAAGAALLAAVLLASVVATGNLVPQRLSDLDVGGLYRSRDGLLALAEVNALLVAGAVAGSRSTGVRLLPVAVVVAAESLRAHPPWEPTALLGSALTAAHLTCAALWAGGLWQVLRMLRGTRVPASGAALLGRFSRAAAGLLAAVCATGVVSALRRMPPDTVLDQLAGTAYGRVLLAKLLLVAVASLLALSARRRVGDACLPRTADPAGAARSAVPARAEVAVLAVVVAVSGLLTALPVPIHW